MKGLLRAGGIALIAGVLLFAGRSWSEPQKPPAPHLRIGLVNMKYVLKNYKKVKFAVNDLKDDEQVEEAIKKLEAAFDQSLKDLAKNRTHNEIMAAIQQQDKHYRELADRQKAAKEAADKMIDQGLVAVYKDIHQAAERYAKAHNLEMVLHYNDVVNENDFYDPTNIHARMRQRACLPLYMAPGLDISKEIVAELNKNVADEKASPADSK
jgi:Skp family chaperone for outer membrane proteins